MKKRIIGFSLMLVSVIGLWSPVKSWWTIGSLALVWLVGISLMFGRKEMKKIIRKAIVILFVFWTIIYGLAAYVAPHPQELNQFIMDNLSEHLFALYLMLAFYGICDDPTR